VSRTTEGGATAGTGRTYRYTERLTDGANVKEEGIRNLASQESKNEEEVKLAKPAA